METSSLGMQDCEVLHCRKVAMLYAQRTSQCHAVVQLSAK